MPAFAGMTILSPLRLHTRPSRLGKPYVRGCIGAKIAAGVAPKASQAKELGLPRTGPKNG
jgi:hypothetical protein